MQIPLESSLSPRFVLHYFFPFFPPPGVLYFVIATIDASSMARAFRRRSTVGKINKWKEFSIEWMNWLARKRIIVWGSTKSRFEFNTRYLSNVTSSLSSALGTLVDKNYVCQRIKRFIDIKFTMIESNFQLYFAIRRIIKEWRRIHSSNKMDEYGWMNNKIRMNKFIKRHFLWYFLYAFTLLPLMKMKLTNIRARKPNKSLNIYNSYRFIITQI